MKHEDSNIPTVWLSACITLRVLELNRASINNAPPVSSQSGASVLLANQTQNTFSSATFTDLLATAQAESLNVQNETSFNPAVFNQSLTQPYQNGNSGAAWSSSNSTEGESEQAPENFSTTPQQLVNSASSPVQTPPKEDVYEGSAASAHKSSTGESESTDSVSASTTNNSGLKATDKSKAHKEVDLASGTQYSQTSVNSGSHVGPAGKDPTVPAVANGNDSVGSPTQSAQTISEPASRTSNAKSTATNSSLAFALRIQGNSAQNPVAETDSGVTAPAATTDQNMTGASSEFAAQLSGMIGLTVSKVNPNAGLANAAGESATVTLSTSPSAGYQPSSDPEEEVSQAEDAAPVAAVPDEPSAAASQPVTTVQVQITGTDDKRIDLKLMEKSGALTMSVRSADGTLTKALQQNLPELSSKLDGEQIRTEWWRPTAQISAPRTSDTTTGGGNAGTQQQEDQNSGDSGGQGRRGAPPPDWLEELSSPRTSNQNGTQYSWHL